MGRPKSCIYAKDYIWSILLYTFLPLMYSSNSLYSVKTSVSEYEKGVKTGCILDKQSCTFGEVYRIAGRKFPLFLQKRHECFIEKCYNRVGKRAWGIFHVIRPYNRIESKRAVRKGALYMDGGAT